MPEYLRPSHTDDALAALARRPLRILAGGTDFYPGKVGAVVDEDILDITAISGLRGIVQEPDHYSFGTATTWTDVLRAALPDWMRALQWAAREVGGPQIQNAGTLGGNVCNASPAADGIPALLALNAQVELRSARGSRRMELGQFLTGNRRSLLNPDELLSALIVPKPTGAARSTFIKLGSRRYLVISIVMVAICIELGADGTMTRAAIAVGACSAVARRLPELERDLIGTHIAQAWRVVQAKHLALTPISDVRGDAAYRREMALALIQDGLRDLR